MPYGPSGIQGTRPVWTPAGGPSRVVGERLPVFPTTPILDSGTRANVGPPPSASWSTDIAALGDAGFKIVSNEFIESATGPSQWSMWWNATAFGTEQEIYLTCGSVYSPPFEVWIRMNNVGTSGLTGYSVHVDATTLFLYRWNAGSSTTLSSTFTHGLGAGARIGLRITGALFECFVASSATAPFRKLCQVTDGTYPTGSRIGILTQGSTQTFTNIGGGNVGTLDVPSGTLYLQTVDVAAVGTPALARGPQLVRSFAAQGVPVTIKQPARILGFTGTGTPAVLKQPPLVRQMAASGAMSVAASLVKLLTLGFAATGTPTLLKRPQPVKKMTGTGTMSRSVQPQLVRQVPVTGTVNRQLRPQLVRQVTSSAAMTVATSLVKLLTLGFTATGTVNRALRPQLVRQVSATGTPTLAKTPARILAFAGQGIASLLKRPSKALPAITSSATPSLSKAPAHVVTVAATRTPTRAKRPARSLAFAASGAVQLLKQPRKTITRTASAAVTIATGAIAAIVELMTQRFDRPSVERLTTLSTDTADFDASAPRRDAMTSPDAPGFDPPTPGV